jgi:hypothetical protein
MPLRHRRLRRLFPPAGPTKVGTINIEGAVFGCNEGRRDLEGLQKKFEPKQAN